MIDQYNFENIPLQGDMYLMDACYLEEYNNYLRQILNEEQNVEHVGAVSYIAANSIGDHSIELSWYPNTFDRFHKVEISLPRTVFKACIGCWRYDIKPTIFVDGTWLRNLYLRNHSVFMLIDTIGMKEALGNGFLDRRKLIQLRDQIDKFSSDNNGSVFISFADSLLVKSNWTVGTWDTDVAYTYQPEKFLKMIPQLFNMYKDILGLNAYAIISQGLNEYYTDELFHIADTRKHISLNSLGLPFAQIMSIESYVRKAIKSGAHEPQNLYIDSDFFHSLNFKYNENDFKQSLTLYNYKSPMSSTNNQYVASHVDTILDKLESTAI